VCSTREPFYELDVKMQYKSQNDGQRGQIIISAEIVKMNQKTEALNSEEVWKIE
jgi:hypothetical protein